MNKLRMAVVGAGRLGGFHAQKLAARDDVDLLAIVDPIPSARDRVAAQCHTEALADYAGLLDRLDGAVIASPTSLHHRIARDFLAAGVPLLVEKPICTSSAEADELVSLARKKNIVLQVGHVERFNPAFHAVASNVRGVKFIDAVRASGYTFRSTDVGVVLDLMIHDIDLVLSIAGSPVRRVEAIGATVVGGHEDIANARIEFENGCVANLSASRVSYEAVRRMHVWSAEGFAAIDFATRTATTVRPSETLLQRQFHVDALTPEQLDYQRTHFADEHLPRSQATYDAVDALAMEDGDFVESIRDSREPRVNGQAGRDALAVAEQVLAAMKQTPSP
jgi:predicted dehydrogenase